VDRAFNIRQRVEAAPPANQIRTLVAIAPMTSPE
jgi:hypothetical protein